MNTMQLEINGKEYTFKASIAFMRDLNKKVKEKANDRDVDVGMIYSLAGVIDRDIEALIDVLYAMNINFTPRIKKETLESYIEDCEDIDGLFDEVTDFLSKANVSKAKMKQLMDAIKKNQKGTK
ncbi:hypothetical protein EDX97_09595 [Absicoccus porci]|uniref:Phage protein n=1 Tax=Absicoccus porci TaxID=2486576 RepID=A0A3N0HZW8_9FIRM|nr:tail assembly chaperone [Absicoccus porci]RNM29866.1 hypothetical protein EDX97_09595 [Absicoccus porci]